LTWFYWYRRMQGHEAWSFSSSFAVAVPAAEESGGRTASREP
jgi:hypothetical protein